MAWLSTSACHTGSQKMTREADIRFLVFAVIRFSERKTEGEDSQSTSTMLQFH